MEFAETRFVDHEQSPPNQRTHATEHYAELINRNRRYGRFRHASSLPKPTPYSLESDPPESPALHCGQHDCRRRPSTSRRPRVSRRPGNRLANSRSFQQRSTRPSLVALHTCRLPSVSFPFVMLLFAASNGKMAAPSNGAAKCPRNSAAALSCQSAAVCFSRVIALPPRLLPAACSE